MKTRHILTILCVVIVVTIAIFLGRQKFFQNKTAVSENATDAGETAKIAYYTCPMHPQVHQDGPGNCPICGMTLVPVYEQQMTPTQHRHDQNEPAPQTPPSQGTPSPVTPSPGAMISPERQQLIGVKSEIVTKKHLVKEFKTAGWVAYDPELATAIREYLTIRSSVPELEDAAGTRLKILGLSAAEIQRLDANDLAKLYLPEKGGAVWVYAPLYADSMNLIGPGTVAKIFSPEGTQEWLGTVRNVDPIVNAMSRSVRARIEVPHAGEILKPQTFVTVGFQIDLGEVLSLPKSAVIDTGDRKLAFLIHDNEHFQSREISTGKETQDDVEIISGLEPGDRVVSSATFLVDAESQLRGAVGGHQH